MDECFNKDPKKERSVGPFNANAEIRNGRAAMVSHHPSVLLPIVTLIDMKQTVRAAQTV